MDTLCSCCQATITAPVWIESKPYGYSCATKVGYKGKRAKKQVATKINKIMGFSTSTRVIVVLETGEKLVGYCRVDSDYVCMSLDIGLKIDWENFMLYR